MGEFGVSWYKLSLENFQALWLALGEAFEGRGELLRTPQSGNICLVRLNKYLLSIPVGLGALSFISKYPLSISYILDTFLDVGVTKVTETNTIPSAQLCEVGTLVPTAQTGS